MKIFELQVGVYIEAEDANEAWKKFSVVVEAANKVDYEEAAYAELVGQHDNMN